MKSSISCAMTPSQNYGALKVGAVVYLQSAGSNLDTVSSYSSSTSKSSRPTTSIPSSTPPSYFSYFASTTPESPSKRARLASILVLAGSRLYDPEIIRERILEEKREKILSLEVALLEGKVNPHLPFAIHDH
jgi:hypothetical protein